MAIIVGKKETRVVPVKAIEPLNNDKTQEHKFTVEVEVLNQEDWRAITDRWDYLGELSQREKFAMARGLDYEPLSDDERKEAKAPAIDTIKHLIKAIDLDVEDVEGNKLTGEKQVEAVIQIPWLRDPIFDCILAVQSGKTTEAFKKARQKNS